MEDLKEHFKTYIDRNRKTYSLDVLTAKVTISLIGAKLKYGLSDESVGNLYTYTMQYLKEVPNA